MHESIGKGMASDEVPAGLWLIGIGPGDLEHMTERARSVARGCKRGT